MAPKDSNSTNTTNIKYLDAQFHEEPIFADALDSFNSDPPSISDIDNTNANSPIQSKSTSGSPSSSNHRQHRMNLKVNKKLNGKLNSARVRASSNSTITTVEEDGRVNSTNLTDSSVSGSNLVFLLVRLVIKTMAFQFDLLFSSVTFPIWLMYHSYMFMVDPFRIINLVKCYLMRNISATCSSVIRKCECVWKLCVRIAWGLFWSVYVGIVLSSLLVFAFVGSGVILKCIIEEPVKVTRELSFDYTKDSPTAFVPLMCCPESSVLESGEPIWGGCGADLRVIPRDHKVYGTVSLMLPESYYNRNLGIFQVRVDFLSGDGKCLVSTSQPCMLRYKSQPIRLMLTFLKLAPLITGYLSETQTLDIKLRGYTERDVPTSCMRVSLEQRAEFTRGAGVPVIYEASLKLESIQPFLKRILWSWKWTVYIWAVVMIFVVELLFILVCCTPVIVPRLQPRGV